MIDTSSAHLPDDANADLPYQEALRARGFEPGESVHEYSLRFTKEDAIRSLIGSAYSTPQPIIIESDDGTIKLPVVLTSARALYTPFTAHIDDSPAGCYEEPDWLFEGWVIPSGFNPYRSPTRVRITVDAPFDGTLLWQVVPTDPVTGEEIRTTTD